MRVTTDEINQAKEVPIIDFINANGIDMNKEGQKYYRSVEHDSLVIDVENNSFHWNSRNIHNSNSINFAMEYYHLKFPEAVKRVNEHEYKEFTNIHSLEKQPFYYPKHYEVSDTKAIKQYLVNERKIDKRVFDWCVKKDLLVQDKLNNAVFKWKDREGRIVGGDRQGTKKIDNKRGTFKNILPSSKEDGGFTINVGKKPNKIAVFESPIDMLSYWSLKKDKLQNTKMVSMSGVKIRTVVNAMKDMKEEGNEIKQIISCVDNDEAGTEFHDKLEKTFKQFKNISLVDDRPKQQKDWNDELKSSLAKANHQNNIKKQVYSI